ncbi:uncharacterized protein (DUF885 family) [Sphingomonas jejuensis]|uniref:Uncharacterized protein (DUF885 family) n=1 Tax=Sphingomonas jejuensis TaxID=904715 RepID=A0ABX0XPK4_9SPHN|nr:DUF885 family protein [Sphingomonas jejuensis]NJC34595.1 uncharacterized protein (DUF885 family) [Sphingomonas jejuensis]
MDRRELLKTGGLAALACLVGPVPLFAQAPAPTPGDTALRAVFDDIFQQTLRMQPTIATGFGLDTGANADLRSKLPDNSLASRARDLQFAKASLARVQVDPQTLSPQMRIHREVVAYMLEDLAVGPERFGLASTVYPFRLSQQSGAYFEIPDFLDSQHPVNNAADAEAYLARLEAFGRSIENDNEVTRHDAGRGWLVPDFALDLTLGQLQALRRPAPGDSTLVRSLVRRTGEKSIAGEWGPRATAIVARTVYPALDRQIALVRELRPAARTSSGVGTLPQGPAVYAAALASATTSTLTPDEVHDMGLRQVAEISAELDQILRAQGLTDGNVGARLTQLNNDPAQLYPDSAEGRAELIAGLNQGVQALRARLPEAFLSPPNDPVTIRAVPVEIQDGAPNGYYSPAALDGSRPAIYYINLKNVADWPKYSLPALTYHEAEPGHHLENSIANKADAPLIRRLIWLSAYGEGWALYAEGVADELGGYSGPIERAGFLQSYLFRAARLVVDTGVHSKGWSRDQATDYMVETTGFTRARAQREIERYCVWPGQACSYKVGHNSWVKMRKRAQEILGDRFDVRQFHGILSEGPVPLTLFERRVEERAREQLAG